MILKRGDLIAVRRDDVFVYALILSKIRLFGGNGAYVFHKTGPDRLSVAQLLETKDEGFHAFVIFYEAKKEGRIEVLQRNIDPRDVCQEPLHYKMTFTTKGKAALWSIHDAEFRVMERVERLSEEQKRYPLFCAIAEGLMAIWVAKAWRPENDERI
jgi:hypothetical protein